jgi:hypothetical protein
MTDRMPEDQTMTTYTERSIDALRRLHAQRTGTPELVKGGKEAAAILSCGVRWMETRQPPYGEGDFGGPLQTALHVAHLFSSAVEREKVENA